ncbi:MAG: PHP domain-containing protein [Firmicutes bacterium]|nr:PHP domain-containing protein [Bacillota bacterium]
MGFDLHTHSTFSDGSLTPGQLVRKATGSGLDGIALTDHDTVAGIEEALSEALIHQFTFLPGIELTTDFGNVEAHILGYNFDFRNQDLLQKLKTVLESRNERARLIIKKLNRARIPLSWEKVKAETTSGFVGRAHIYRALRSAGLVTHGREAFNYYLGKNGIAYVPHQEIETFEAIALLREAGGISVLAHPGRMANDGLVARLVAKGLQGIEAYYPTHTKEQTERYLKMAAKYDLIITGGSDFHGAFSQTKLGDAQVKIISNWAYPKISLKKF